MGLLDSEGLINHALLGLGLIDQPLQLLHTAFSVQLVMVYTYLPFMILPLYSNLVKLDGRLLEAAADLGCKPWRAFVSVTLPLSKTASLPAPCWCSSRRWVSLSSPNWWARRS